FGSSCQRFDHYDLFHIRQIAARNRLDLRQKLFADDERPRAGVVENVPIVGRSPQRVDGNRHGADFDRTEKAVGEFGTVDEKQDDLLLETNIDRVAQRAPEPVDAFEKLAVADALVAALDRDGFTPALVHVPVDKVCGDVEIFGD